MTMKTRILATLSALLLTLGLSLAGPAPAQAAFGGVCANNSFCLYQWTGLGAQVANNRWQSSYNNIIGGDGCLTLGSAAWANGTLVTDNSASIMWKTTVSGYENYAITVFNWQGCNAAGPFKVIGYLGSANTQYSLDNLNNYVYSNATQYKLYHTISSIGIRYCC
jgi:hypothetical protein